MIRISSGRVFKIEMKMTSCSLLDFFEPRVYNWSLPSSFHKTLNAHRDVTEFNVIDNFVFYNTLPEINVANTLRQKKYVYFLSNYDLIDGFRSSKIHQPQVAWMVNRTRDEVNAAVFNSLFKLSPKMQARLGAFVSEVRPPKHKLICAHIRMGRNPSIPFDSVIRHTAKDLGTVWHFINNFTSPSEGNKVFFMSDSRRSYRICQSSRLWS